MVIGPTANKEGTVQMAKNTYFSPLEVDAARYLNAKEVEMNIQLLPSEPKVSVGSVLEKM
jgi:mannose/fructose/N-acetylgalactosamine-specific phosphotransferase system component IIB